MRCFTDEEIRRGLAAVIGHVGTLVTYTPQDYVAIFLQAAQPGNVDARGVVPTRVQVNDRLALQTWPFPHPMHCPACDRAITDATGRSLVKIVIEDSIWKCATCP